MNYIEALKVLRNAAQRDLDKYMIQMVDLNKAVTIAEACMISYDVRIKELEGG